MNKKKYIGMFLAIVLVFSLTIPVLAAGGSAQIRPDFNIILDGEEIGFTHANGEVANPVLYKDTTYLPLRAVGNIMGKNVNWEEKTKTVTLSGTSGNNDTSAKKTGGTIQTIKIDERSDFVVVVDGVTQTFQTASGEKVVPILYNGSTYLPLRAIGQIMGKDVQWDNKSKTVTLSQPGGTVTDADSFNNTTNSAVNNQGSDIGVDKAKEIALTHASLKEKDVTFISAKIDTDDGIKVYEIEFYYGLNEYDYDVNATTGAIISFDKDIENYTINNTNSKNITLDKAKEIALNNAGLKAGSVTFLKAELDSDDGLAIYDIEFRYGNMKYEYEINASTGKIIEFDKDDD